MTDRRKTKAQLVEELDLMRQRMAELEAREARPVPPPVQVDTIDARQLLASLRAFRKGDFSVRLSPDQIGLVGEIAEAFNDTVELAAGLNAELARIGTVVGKEGRISEWAKLMGAIGGWGECADSVNALINDMV